MTDFKKIFHVASAKEKRSTAPFVSFCDSTRGLMSDFLIAMLPAAVWGVIAFGLRALVILLISVFTAVLTEVLYCLVLRRPQSASNLQSAVTGLMLGLLLPASVPYWMPALGAFCAVLLFQLVFRDLGINIISPVLGGYAVLTIWKDRLTAYPTAFEELPLSSEIPADLLSSGPIAVLRSGEIPDDGIFNLIFGKCAGAIGTVSAFLLIAGAVYLTARRVYSLKLPFLCLAGAAVTAVLLPVKLDRAESAFAEILGGSIIFAVVFLSSDFTALPVNDTAREIYAAGCGVLCVLMRKYGPFAEPVPYALLVMNLLSRPLDYFTKPRVFGRYPKDRGKKSPKEINEKSDAYIGADDGAGAAQSINKDNFTGLKS